MGVTFYFKQAYGLTSTTNGFRCNIETNNGNIKRVDYTFTAQELADINSGKILAMDVVRRVVKANCDIFCAQLQADWNAQTGWTQDVSGNLSRTMTTPTPAVTFSSTTISSSQLVKQGNYIPLYSWNANGYQQVVTDKQNNPAVTIIATLNPNNGPGSSKSATIATAANALKSASVITLMYVGTNYGSELTKAQYPVGNPWPSNTPRDLASVKQDCLNAVTWYGVDGFMFDDFSNTQYITLPDGTKKDVYNTFYVPLFQYARSLTGVTYIKGNMGTKPLYMPLADLCDNVCVFENSRNPTLAELQNNTYNGQLMNKATIVVNSVATLDTTAMAQCGQYAKYYYSSDSGYAKPPIYYDQLISTLATS